MKAEDRRKVIERAEELLTQIPLDTMYDHADVKQFLQEHPASDFLKGMMLGIALIEHSVGI